MSAVLRGEAMRRPRRNHSSEFKAKVAMAAILGKIGGLGVGEEV
jgi:hypothetical protein